MRVFAGLAGLVCLLASGAAMAAEEPSYTLVERVGSIEIRDYPGLIHAEVTVRGDRQTATRRGFQPLANYIFGGNQPREDIAMTAPVTASRSGQSIAMTAPVTSEPAGEGEWVVSFIMPSEWTMETVPVANDPDVRLREAPPLRVLRLGDPPLVKVLGLLSRADCAKKTACRLIGNAVIDVCRRVG